MKHLVALLVLLALLAAAPFSLKPLFHARFKRAEAAAVAAYPPHADTNGPAIPPIPARATLPRLWGGPGASVQPIPAEYLESVRAWCASNPAEIAAFERVTDPVRPFRPSRAFPFFEAPTFDHGILGTVLLRDAVERADAARVEDLDRRLRFFARMLGAPRPARFQAQFIERERLSVLPRALPLLPDGYLEECDADACERVRAAATNAVFLCGAEMDRIRANLETVLRSNRREGAFRRYFADCDVFLSAANDYRIHANVPAAIARCEALFEGPRDAFADGLAAAEGTLADGCLEQWPRVFPIVKDEWSGASGFNLTDTGYVGIRNNAELERLVVALERHRRRTGAYPERLADLFDGDEDALPRMFPTGDPPDYEVGDLPVRVQRFAVLFADDEPPEDPEMFSAVFHGYRLRVRTSPRLEWGRHRDKAGRHGDCEFSPDCIYHLDAGRLLPVADPPAPPRAEAPAQPFAASAAVKR